MSAKSARVLRLPTQGFVCFSCRSQSLGVERTRSRRYKHTSVSDNNGGNQDPEKPARLPEQEQDTSPGTASKIRDIIRQFVSKDAGKDIKSNGPENGNNTAPEVELPDKKTAATPKSKIDGDVDRESLQQKFAAQRRKDLLGLQAEQSSKEVDGHQKTLEQTLHSNAPSITPPKARKIKSPTSKSTRRIRKMADKEAAKKAKLKAAAAKRSSSQSDRAKTQTDTAVTKSTASSNDGSETMQAEATSKEMQHGKIDDSIDESTPKHMPDIPSSTVTTGVHLPNDSIREVKPASSSSSVPSKGHKAKGTSKKVTKADSKASKLGSIKSPSELERKADLAKKLRKHVVGDASTDVDPDNEVPGNVHFQPGSGEKVGLDASKRLGQQKSGNKGTAPSSRRKKNVSISDVVGFNSIKGAIGKKAGKADPTIETADTTTLEIQPLKVDQPPVPGLSYGLERVLFNPGVYQLQDPRSRVYNFDPYLQKIMPVAEFDFSALKEYITSSKDESLKSIAKAHGKRYLGSTSSMTGILAHFHFLLSQWRPINTSMLSKDFPTHLSSFTELQRTPSAIFLRWKDGSYAIDADKQFASANVLSMLGKSMEKLLTLSTEDYERYRKSSSAEVTDEEQFAPESYHYSTMGDFLMRSQLDAHDPRLPGTGMFDLKTRAVVSIRMDVSNYEHGLGYQIKNRQGEWESYEREYYDLIRAAFLKYSMQVRMGRMDGIFVAFHNIERIFGFQYISLPEMDSTIHGQWDTSIGDQEFKLSLDLLNKILDKATKKFPETSLRIHFETREAATPFMYIFAEPVTEEQVVEIQGQNDAKIQEFEQKVLGLDPTRETETEDNDGEWEDIQASVQEAMDKDELSVDDPSRNQESESLNVQDAELENSELESEDDLDAKSNIDGGNDSTCITASDQEGNDIAEEEEGEISDVEDTKNQLVDNDEESNRASSAQEPEVADEEESKVAEVMQEQGANEVRTHKNPIDTTEAFEEESAVVDDPRDRESETPTGSTEATDPAPIRSEDGQHLRDGAGKGSPSSEENMDSEDPLQSTPATKGFEQAQKEGYMPPSPGEESSGSEYQIDADRPFLDSVDQETAKPTSEEAASNLLGMTLTLRNKVNGQFVHRPERMTAEDVWSIEYSLVEIPSETRAKALYEACQTRRKKKLDMPLIPEDAEVINHYLKNLRKLSSKGKAWRKEMDEQDRKKPAQVLGQAVAKEGEEGLSDQESEA